MIEITNVDVWGFEHAIRGLRNPMNSWDKSDSNCTECHKNNNKRDCETCFIYVGEKDLDLMRRLYNAGTEHRKYLRQIVVSMDITAPLYWWKEFDTYKVGTTANSCSTMHKLTAKEFDLEDFSGEHLICSGCDLFTQEWDKGLFSRKVQPQNLLLDFIIPSLNKLRELYIKTNDKKYWWQIIQLLPSSYNQKRTITMNYENVVSMIHQRKNHKLDEWVNFVDILLELPYIKEIISYEDEV